MRHAVRASMMMLGVAAILMLDAGSSRASLQLLLSSAGSGVNADGGSTVAGKANFYFDTAATNTLVIDLFNTTIGGTKTPADILVGVVFNVDGITANLNNKMLVSPSLITQAGTSTELGGSGGDADFRNKWKTAAPVGQDPSLGEFGVATNGFGGGFNGRGLNAGDHGIVANGTTLTEGLNSLPHQPVSMNGLQVALTFKGKTDFSKALASISGVRLLFGTAGTGVIHASAVNSIQSVPEPSTMVMAFAGLVPMVLARRQRRLA